MNVREGLRRMQHAGRRITIVSVIALVLMVVLFEAWVYLRDVQHADAVMPFLVHVVFWVVPVAALGIVVGVILWVAGWIMDGFTKSNPS